MPLEHGAGDDGVVKRVLDLVHRHLGMDVTYVSHFVEGRQEFPAYIGDAASFGIDSDDGIPIGSGYCSRMATGELPNVIPDATRDSRVSELPLTRAAGIGAYIGVPIRLSDGTLYGSFCCASKHPDPELSGRDVHFMQVLADLMVAELDREHRRERTRATICDVIGTGSVTIALQPVIDLTTGRRVGVEALARFPASVGTPATLFPAAHEVGLTVELEQLAAARALDLAPMLHDHEFLSINMSPEALLAGAALAEQHRPELATDQLVFEMTENQAIEHYDEMRRQLRPLRDQGIRVAIDDAGAGYASLYHIVQLEPDLIKIDRRLVHGCSGDRARRSVIRGFVALAADLGAVVIGEGVETPEDLSVLRELGVHCAQGYLLGRPSVDYNRLRTGLALQLPAPRRP